MAFKTPKISAYDALSQAQQIAFAPVVFQVARALRDLGILEALEKAGAGGCTAHEIAQSVDVSTYGVETLLESGLSFNAVELLEESRGDYGGRVYGLTKIGYFLLRDLMTRVNVDFVHDVCYQGLARLVEAVSSGTPAGLDVFGKHWKTLYEAVPTLPAGAKESWYAFDHFYSDESFPRILPLVLNENDETLADIGANTGKFAVMAARYSASLKVFMIDLPGQLQIAMERVQKESLEDRIFARPMNLLEDEIDLPGQLDVYWMSQLLSCFSHREIVRILQNVRRVMRPDSRLMIMETCWDRQKHEASAFSLVNTSPYFTCMANGNSKMYHSDELTACIQEAGLYVHSVRDNLKICHSLFECRPYEAGN